MSQGSEKLDAGEGRGKSDISEKNLEYNYSQAPDKRKGVSSSRGRGSEGMSKSMQVRGM